MRLTRQSCWGENGSVKGKKMKTEDVLTRKEWLIILNAVEKLIQIIFSI